MIKIDNCFTFMKNDIIVVGCSTGPDSMALIDMLIKIAKFFSVSTDFLLGLSSEHYL